MKTNSIYSLLFKEYKNVQKTSKKALTQWDWFSIIKFATAEKNIKKDSGVEKYSRG